MNKRNTKTGGLRGSGSRPGCGLNGFGRPFLLLLCLGSLVVSYSGGKMVTAAQFAPPAGVEIQARAGLGPNPSPPAGSWVPFRILISNHGDPVSGRLVVSMTTSNGQDREYSEDVQLANGATQGHEISALFANGQEDTEVKLVTGPGSNERVLASTKVSISTSGFFSDELTFGILDTEPSTLNAIASTPIDRGTGRVPFKVIPPPQPDPDASGAPSADVSQNSPGAAGASTTGAGNSNAPPPGTTPGTTTGTGNQPSSRRAAIRQHRLGGGQLVARPKALEVDDLPREFVSYDGLDALVIGDAPLDRLSSEQSQALRLWVAGGGLLIVTGGADFAGLRTAGLDPLMPVDPESSVTIPALPELTSVYGAFDTPDPLVVTPGKPRAGANVVVARSGSALIAERPYCDGMVRFVGVNPKLNPLRAWSKSRELWTDLLLPAAEFKRARLANYFNFQNGGGGRGVAGIESALYELANVKPPSSAYFLTFLILYILAVGPANYLVLRWRKKLDLAWVTIPALVILFAGFSVGAAQVARGSSNLTADAETIEIFQHEGVARLSGGFMIIPTSGGEEQMKFPGNGTYLNDWLNTSAGGRIEYRRDPRGLTLAAELQPGSGKSFRIRAARENQSALFELVAGPDPTQFKVKNSGPAAMTSAMLLTPAGVSELFDLAPGENKQVSVGKAFGVTLQGIYTSKLVSGTPAGDLFAARASESSGRVGTADGPLPGLFDSQPLDSLVRNLGGPVLICFGNQTEAPVEINGAVKRLSQVLYIVHL